MDDAVDAPSSYLAHLPPVLWQHRPEAPDLPLGDFLRIFEKVLTGIADDVRLAHGDHSHPALTDQIGAVEKLFDPWKAPADFLPWLASWLSLEFPTLQGQPLWDEYQRRRVTAQIARIQRRRGLKSGLATYLELFAVGRTMPRVALDDGSRVLVTTPQPAQLAPVSTLVGQGPVITSGKVQSEGLIRPWCAAMAGDGSIFIGDTGIPASVPLALKNRVWRISPAGAPDLTGTPPRPLPVAGPTMPLNRVVAVAVRPAPGGAPETLYVLDRSGKLFAVPAPYLDQPATVVTTLVSGNTTFWPVAMAVDGTGDLLVLDRGDGPGTPNPPKITTVRPKPLGATSRSLGRVVEPLSLLVRPDGSLVVGDGGEQSPAAGPGPFPGNLVAVDRGTTPWTETLLLPDGNPLVAPTAVTAASDGVLFVLDAGLKPFAPPTDPFVLAAAEPAGVFRVDLRASPPSVVRVTEAGHMVFPTGMVADGERLVICDPGQPEVAGLVPVWSRLQPFRFDVVIHFVDGRLPADPQQRATVQRQVVGNIRTVVEQERPAHTLWSLVTAI